MSKIEELTEILVNEIEDFNKGITKLEKINDQISTTKIRMDLAEYKSIIEKHQQKMDDQLRSQERFENQFKSVLKNAKVYPNWAVIVFIATFLIGVTATSYSYKLYYDLKTIEKKAYRKGLVDSNKYIQTFFESSPKSKKAFDKWEKEIN